MSSIRVKPSPGAESRDVERRFRELAETWQSDCGPSSSAVQMAMHPAYQQIIGIGPPVIPLLLRALEEHADHWFWALRAVTGDDPVPESARGRIPQMRQAWIEWGRANGYGQQKVQEAHFPGLSDLD